MPAQTVTLNVPDAIFLRLQERARQSSRSIEAELLDVIATAIPLADDLPPDLAEAILPLSSFGDDDLWRTARSRLDPKVAAELEALHLKQQREGLTESERQLAASLLRQYERAMLMRAQAAALLKQRGHNIDELLPAP